MRISDWSSDVCSSDLDERMWHRSSPKSNHRRAIPGFGLTLGFTITWLSLIVLIPLSTIFIRATGMGWDDFVAVGLSARALTAYQLSFGASLAAGGLNTIFGLLVARVLVRQDFAGRLVVRRVVTECVRTSGSGWSPH